MCGPDSTVLPPAMPVPALGPGWLRGHFLPCSSEWEFHPFPVPGGSPTWPGQSTYLAMCLSPHPKALFQLCRQPDQTWSPHPPPAFPWRCWARGSEIPEALEQAWCQLSVSTPTTLYPLARTPGFTSPEQMLAQHSGPIRVRIIKNSHVRLPRAQRSPEEERTQCPLLKRSAQHTGNN